MLDDCTETLPVMGYAEYERKQQIQRMVFPDGILYHKQKGVVRTPRVNSLFEAIPLLAGDSSKNKKSRFIKESASIQQSAQDWIRTSTPCGAAT